MVRMIVIAVAAVMMNSIDARAQVESMIGRWEGSGVRLMITREGSNYVVTTDDGRAFVGQYRDGKIQTNGGEVVYVSSRNEVFFAGARMGPAALPECNSQTVQETIGSIFRDKNLPSPTLTDIRQASTTNSRRTCGSQYRIPNETGTLTYAVFWENLDPRVIIESVK